MKTEDFKALTPMQTHVILILEKMLVELSAIRQILQTSPRMSGERVCAICGAYEGNGHIVYYGHYFVPKKLSERGESK